MVSDTKITESTRAVSDTRRGKHRSPRVTLVVSDTILARLNAVAEAGNFTVSDTIRFCTERVLPELEKAWLKR